MYIIFFLVFSVDRNVNEKHTYVTQENLSRPPGMVFVQQWSCLSTGCCNDWYFLIMKQNLVVAKKAKQKSISEIDTTDKSFIMIITITRTGVRAPRRLHI